MKTLFFLNGKFLHLDESKIPVLDPGFLSGCGVFETMRSYKKKIVFFDQHIQRLIKSAKIIGLKCPYSSTKLKEIIRETIKRNSFGDTYIRLTLWKSVQGTGILVMAKNYKPYSQQKYKNGFSACVSKLRQNDPFIAQIKSTSRFLYQLSLDQAQRKGFDEAIILNNLGLITEGTKSNLFFVKNTELFTPSLNCGCLNGITRKVIFELAQKFNLKLYEGNFTIQDLLDADEAFLTNSLMGVMPLASVEKKPIGKNKCRKITNIFIEKYNCLLK